MDDEVLVTDNAIRINDQELRFWREAGAQSWVYAEGDAPPHPLPAHVRRLLAAVHPLLLQQAAA